MPSSQPWPLGLVVLSAVVPIVEAGRDLLRTSGQTALLKQGQFAQDCVRLSFEDLQGCRVHNLPGQPIPVFSHLHISLIIVAFSPLSQLLPPWTTSLCWTVHSVVSPSLTLAHLPPEAHLIFRKQWAKPEQLVIPPQDNIPSKLFLLALLECMLGLVKKL